MNQGPSLNDRVSSLYDSLQNKSLQIPSHQTKKGGHVSGRSIHPEGQLARPELERSILAAGVATKLGDTQPKHASPYGEQGNESVFGRHLQRQYSAHREHRTH